MIIVDVVAIIVLSCWFGDNRRVDARKWYLMVIFIFAESSIMVITGVTII